MTKIQTVQSQNLCNWQVQFILHDLKCSQASWKFGTELICIRIRGNNFQILSTELCFAAELLPIWFTNLTKIHYIVHLVSSNISIKWKDLLCSNCNVITWPKSLTVHSDCSTQLHWSFLSLVSINSRIYLLLLWVKYKI